MASVWGTVCYECQVLAQENCPHCMKDFCEKHSPSHDCERPRSQDYAVAG